MLGPSARIEYCFDGVATGPFDCAGDELVGDEFVLVIVGSNDDIGADDASEVATTIEDDMARVDFVTARE